MAPMPGAHWKIAAPGGEDDGDDFGDPAGPTIAQG
jgi:hypothetical protein